MTFDGTVPVLLSAHSPALLRAEAAAILGYVQRHESASPEAVASTLAATRVSRRHRALISAHGRDDLLGALASVAQDHEHPALLTAEASAPAKIAFVFPGQGNQSPGMGRLYHERSDAFRAEVELCDTAFQELGAVSPLDYLLDREAGKADTAGVVQPALFTQMAGLAAMWRTAGVSPQVTIGHSLGEVVAAYVSGHILLADACRIVVRRAAAADSLAVKDFAMAIVGADRDVCESLIAGQVGWAEVSLVNSANFVGVSGDEATVARIVGQAQAEGLFARRVQDPYPAHISLLQSVRDEFIGALDTQLEHSTFLPTPVPCVSSATGAVLRPGDVSSAHWFKNIRNVVRFDRAVETARELGANVFVEVSGHPLLVPAITETIGDQPCRVVGTSRRTAEDLGEFAENLAATRVLDAGFPGPESAPRPLLRGFPNAPMGRQRFWSASAEEAPAVSVASPIHVVQERWEPVRAHARGAVGNIAVVDLLGRCHELADRVRSASADASSAAPPPGATVVLLPEQPGLDVHGAVDALAEFCEALSALPGSDGPTQRYLLVTTNGERAAPGDQHTSLSHSAFAAAFRSFAHEHPRHRFAHLDLAAGAQPSFAAELILAAARIESEPELAARDGALLAKRWSFAPSATGSLPNLGHVVVFGGTGSFGLELCAHFCEQGARAVTLVSRTGAAAVDPTEMRRIRARFEARIEVLACDVADAAAVRQLAARQTEPASVIVHAAVQHSYGLSHQLDHERVRRACAAKVIGAQHILDHWPRTQDALTVLFSSVVATFGVRGQIVYAASNRMLDTLAGAARASGSDCVSVQWGVWRAGKPIHIEGLGSMSNEDLLLALEDTGLPGMDPAAAAEAGLARRGGNVAVLAADWPRMRAYLDGLGGSAFLHEIVGEVATPKERPEPGRPLAATAEEHGSASVAQRVRYELAEVMGMQDDAAAIDGSVPLVALGLDSLLALELRKRIRTAVSLDVPLQQIMGGASLDDMVTILTGANAEVNA